jgi:succinate-semialdehyde dehydrogenase/glutarate-semialdehyde dehydrogenase
MKPSIMELGGQAPVIVCADTDPVAAARSAVRAKVVNAGQVCTWPSRFLVDRRILPAFTDAFVAAMLAIKVGNGLGGGVQMGPMVSERGRQVPRRRHRGRRDARLTTPFCGQPPGLSQNL